MTRGRPARLWFAVLAGAALAAGAGGCVYVPKYERHEESSRLAQPLAPQERLVVDNPRGTTRLTSIDGDRVEITAYKRVLARNRESARRIAGDIRVELARAGADLTLTVEYPEGISSGKVSVVVLGGEVRRPSAGVDLEIGVPRGAPIEVITRNGDLVAESVEGALSFRTANGDARVTEHRGDLVLTSRSGDALVGAVAGRLEMRTASGDLTFDSAGGDLTFNATSGDLVGGRTGGQARVATGSGDVELESVVGSLTASSTSGDLAARAVGGAVEVNTASGDVEIGLEGVPERVYVRTSSGDVALRLRDPLRGRLRVTTSSGEVQAALPMALDTARRGHLSAVLGPGTGAVDINTSSGDVSLVHAGARASSESTP